MPRKNREVERDLLRAGFTMTPGKGSHRKYDHPKATEQTVISGKAGDDARGYQVRKAYKQIAIVKAAEQGEQR
jgi:predicted RNA binding protein YcfA (HicA-like mRNA interferase family)